jgi:hypothetical protein
VEIVVVSSVACPVMLTSQCVILVIIYTSTLLVPHPRQPVSAICAMTMTMTTHMEWQDAWIGKTVTTAFTASLITITMKATVLSAMSVSIM